MKKSLALLASLALLTANAFAQAAIARVPTVFAGLF